MTSTSPPLAPRVLVILGDQWPRALLRASLIDAGYDAVGARTIPEALSLLTGEGERGPVRLLIIDRRALGDQMDGLSELLGRCDHPPVVLVAAAGETAPSGAWSQVIRRPVTIGEIVAAVQARLPLASTDSGSTD